MLKEQLFRFSDNLKNMFRKSTIIFTLIFCCAFVLKANAQTFLDDSKPPNDLVITLEEKGRFKYEIRSDGSVTYYPISVTTFILDGTEVSAFITQEKGKLTPIKPKTLEKKTKLSEQQLSELILEFEKINFFGLSNSYLRADKVCEGDYYVSGPTVLTNLSIQNNSRLSKSIVFEKGCNSDATAKLKNLSNKIIKIINTIKFKTDNSLNINKN